MWDCKAASRFSPGGAAFVRAYKIGRSGKRSATRLAACALKQGIRERINLFNQHAVILRYRRSPALRLHHRIVNQRPEFFRRTGAAAGQLHQRAATVGNLQRGIMQGVHRLNHTRGAFT